MKPKILQDIDDINSQLAENASQISENTTQINNLKIEKADNARIDNIIAQSGTSDTEVVDARTSNVKNKTFTTITNRLDELDLSTNYPATNLIPNGDFSNGGASGWINNGLQPFSVANKELICLANSEGDYAYRPIDVIAGKKYFVKVSVKTTSNKVGLVFDNKLLYHSGSGNYEELSLIYYATASKSAILAITDNRASGWDNFYITKVIAVNLTDIYQSGLEPTLPEFKQILSAYPNSWFNGTVNLIPNFKQNYKNNYLYMDEIKGTKQSITFNIDGSVQKVTHTDTISSIVIRTDMFTYEANLVTEVRTHLNGDTLTLKYHLDTLETEVI